MHNMYDTETYEFMREKYGATITWTGTPGQIYQGDVVMIKGWCHESAPLLYRHIIAEQLLANYENIDWINLTQLNIRRLIRIAELWMHPLVYCTWEDLRQFAIDGWAAKEEYAPDRKKQIREVLNYIKNQWALFFGRNPIVLENDALFVGMIKGMYMWHLITACFDMPIERVLNGEYLKDEDIEQMPIYDTLTLRENLTYIAKEYGGEQAAWLLRTLREEWPKMKMWKTGFEDEEEVVQFEQVLFNGYDELLSEWESEAPKETQEPNKSFSLLTDECRAENKEAKVISELRAACKGTAVGLWKVIRENEALGYLCTRGMQSSKIYRAIVEFFGELPYSERNFRDARDKK